MSLWHSKITEYDNDVEVAVAKSDATWVSEELFRTDRSDEWNAAAYQWLRYDSTWFIEGAPQMVRPWANTETLIGICQYQDKRIMDLLWRLFVGKKTTMRVRGRTRRARIPGDRYPLFVAHPEHFYLYPKGIKPPELAPAKLQKLPRYYRANFASVYLDLENADGLVIKNRPWLPSLAHPDQIQAADYSRECARLQASKAGRKAKQILIDNLTRTQADDYFRKGHFVVAAPKKEEDATPPLYAIVRGFPNGNVLRLEGQEVQANYCYHPEEPFPLDDILLTQKLMIEHHEDEFLATANKGSLRRRLDVNTFPADVAYRGDVELSGAARFEIDQSH